MFGNLRILIEIGCIIAWRRSVSADKNDWKNRTPSAGGRPVRSSEVFE
jgi:hypothetical protein